MDPTAGSQAEHPADANAAPKPAGVWNTLLTSLPVGLTILATAFAGLSSSEMTQSMYYRSLAAQHQSKAGDQWSFFQAKRIRGTNLEMTAELLRSLGNPAPFAPEEIDVLLANLLAAIEKAPTGKAGADDIPQEKATAEIKKARDQLVTLLKDETVKASLPYLTGSKLPKVDSGSLPTIPAQNDISAAIDAIRQRQTEAETADLIRKISPKDIDEAIHQAEQNADAFDKTCAPINDTIKKFRSLFAELSTAVRPLRKPSQTGQGTAPLTALENEEKGFRRSALEFDSKRYQQESILNRSAAEVYEVRVRRSGVESDRFRERSKLFFYSMLMAQAGVTVASLALAGTQRKPLWLFAAFAGLIALGFSSYVYLSF